MSRETNKQAFGRLIGVGGGTGKPVPGHDSASPASL